MNLYDAIIQDKINIKRAEHQQEFGKPMSDGQQQWEEIKLRLPRVLKRAVILTLIVAAVYAIFSAAFAHPAPKYKRCAAFYKGFEIEAKTGLLLTRREELAIIKDDIKIMTDGMREAKEGFQYERQKLQCFLKWMPKEEK